MKKILAIMLIMAIAIIIPVCTTAEEDITTIITPFASGFFSSYGISMTKSGTTVHIAFRTTAVETMAKLGVLTYDVQRLVSGSWTTVANDVTGSTGSDTASYSFSKNYSATAGYSYRVVGKFYAKKYDGTSATSTVTSSSISV